MRHLSRVLLIAALAALAVPALASAAPSPTSGTVVQRDVRAGALVLATHTGALQRVQLAKPNRFAMGAVVQVRGSNVRVVGHAHSAKIHGVVLQSAHGSYTLAGNGSVLAVSTATPPPVGQPVTATVQVSPTALSCDHAHMQVGDTQAPSAELRGTVLSQDATTLRLSVFGFTSGLAIALGGQTIPTLAVGTQVEARVSLGPDPANPSGIVLTLVALRVDDNNNNDDEQGSFVKVEGQVTAVTEAGPAGGAVGSITIAGEQGDVTFVIPAGFGATGAVVGDEVEARGTAATTPDGQPTLVRLEGKDDGHGQFGGHHHHRGSGDGSGGGSGNWGGGGGSDGGSGGGSDGGSGGDN